MRTHPKGNFYASYKFVRYLSCRSVESLFDELPQSSTVFNFTDLAKLVGDVFLGVEIPEEMREKPASMRKITDVLFISPHHTSILRLSLSMLLTSLLKSDVISLATPVKLQ